MVTSSSGAHLPTRPLTVPSWVVDSDIPLHSVSFSTPAQHSLQEIVGQKQLKFYHSYDDVVEFISQVCLLSYYPASYLILFYSFVFSLSFCFRFFVKMSVECIREEVRLLILHRKEKVRRARKVFCVV